LQLRSEGKTTATVIRHKEEAELIEKYGKVPLFQSGKLSENQLFEMLKSVHDDPSGKCKSKIIENYPLDKAAVEAVLNSTRFPEITYHKLDDTTQMKIAK
jgi:hypothetical protein